MLRRRRASPRAVAALGIAAEDGIPVHSSPLSGLDPEEILDASALAADLRRALAQTSLAARLAPKVSVAIDGGGGLSLDELAADVRLCAETINNGVAFRVGVGGDAARATQLGVVAPTMASRRPCGCSKSSRSAAAMRGRVIF